jgi:inositol transport system substrate-binding protein
MKKIVCVVCAIAFCVMAFGGCSKSTTSSSATSQVVSQAASASEAGVISAAKVTGKKVTIGYSVYWMSEFSTLLTAGMETKATDLGVNLTFMNANSDSNAQLGQIENFIAQKVDAIICAPVDTTAIKPAIAEAKAAGIPFVAVNMYVDDPDLSAYSGPNDVQAGEMETQAAITVIGGKGNVIIIDGGDGFSATTDRIKGAANILKKYPNVKVLAEKSGNWSTSTAQSMMEDYIQHYGSKINAVVCANDDMAMGVLQALKSKNMTNVALTGIDATKDGCTAIKNGQMTATVYQDANLEGGNAVALAVNLSQGLSVTKNNLIQMTVVTKANVNKYLDLYN